MGVGPVLSARDSGRAARKGPAGIHHRADDDLPVGREGRRSPGEEDRNAHLFEAVLTRKAVHKRLIGELLSLFGGSAAPVMSHLVETGKLTLADVKELEKRLAAMEGKS